MKREPRLCGVQFVLQIAHAGLSLLHIPVTNELEKCFGLGAGGTEEYAMEISAAATGDAVGVEIKNLAARIVAEHHCVREPRDGRCAEYMNAGHSHLALQ